MFLMLPCSGALIASVVGRLPSPVSHLAVKSAVETVNGDAA